MRKKIFLILFFCSNFILYGQDADFYSKLSEAAIGIMNNKIVYDPKYYKIPYPNGDVAADRGVCTDVVIRAYRKLDIDLQKEVHQDMKANFSKYPSRKKWGLNSTDTNIDHRRVPNLQVFLSRKSTSIPVTNKADDYLAGDIITWKLSNGLDHIGIVVSRKSRDGKRHQVVHNIGRGQVMEDILFSWTITGHYRYKK